MKLSRFSIIMIIIVGICIVLAVAVPVRKSIQSKNDRLLESGISGVSTGIQQYYTKNSKLPKSLNEITVYDSDAKSIIANNLVEYRIVSDPVMPSTQKYDSNQPAVNIYTQSGKNNAQYELCATYKFATDDKYSEPYNASIRTYPSNSHPAGRSCQVLSTGY